MTDVLCRTECELGESPVWHPERQSCFWVDVEGRAVFEYHLQTGFLKRYQLNSRVSLIIPSAKNELVLGLQGGIIKFDLLTETIKKMPSPDVNWEQFRCNDGGADAFGRLWVSTMELNHKQEAGAIYCIEKDGSVRHKAGNISIPNGIVWSADQKRMYFTDSVKGEIYAYLFDAESGDIAFEKIAIRIAEGRGLPDGMALDEENMLWVALWGGYGVGRFNLVTGRMTDFIDIPAPHVTACCFAGEELDYMIITTATSGMSDEALKAYPESGNVFITKTNIKGRSIHYADL